MRFVEPHGRDDDVMGMSPWPRPACRPGAMPMGILNEDRDDEDVTSR